MARSVEACERALAAMVPGFAPSPLESLDELEVGVAWAEDAAPLVRERVLEAAALFAGHRPLELPRPEGTSTLFMHEVADVHRELFAENADLYGEDVRIKIERCLQVTDGEAENAARRRAEYRERMDELVDGVDLLLTPTLPIVAPRIGEGGTGDLEVRETLISRTYPFNLLGWPALALPCGPAEDGLPASVQLVGRPGQDSHVLAAGRMLEAALADGT
jgi:aspartyl-tRNA(Asn)/glutamyl-tRNA(Gln) amidotransferase subunit A